MVLASSKGFSAGKISPSMLHGVGFEAKLERPSNWAVEIRRCGEAERLQGYLAGRKTSSHRALQ